MTTIYHRKADPSTIDNDNKILFLISISVFVLIVYTHFIVKQSERPVSLVESALGFLGRISRAHNNIFVVVGCETNMTVFLAEKQRIRKRKMRVFSLTVFALFASASVPIEAFLPCYETFALNGAVDLFSVRETQLRQTSPQAQSQIDRKRREEGKGSSLGMTTIGNENTQDGDETTTANNSIEYSFYDEVTILVRAGSGGQGASTYKKGVGGQNGPPDGGNGGNGGNVVLVVDDSLNTLAGLSPSAYRANAFGGSGAAVGNAQASGSHYRRYKSFRAEIGCDGGRQMKNGRYGKDVLIRVPPGTVVHEVIDDDDDVNESLLEMGTLLLPEQGAEITSQKINDATGGDSDDNIVMTRRMRSSLSSYIKPTTTLVVARGGEGGEGSGINQKGRGLQRPRLSPQGGERRKLRLTLKLVADVALVGVPNAGKSTFLSKVTRAKPRIADYPFTTVIPNLGVWVPPELFDKDEKKSISGGTGGNGLVLCDVPGLIEGASRGVGLGHAFLRHVERCHVILHLVDAMAEDPIKDFQMLNGELIKYGTGQLARMPQVVVINKTDAYNDDSPTKPRLTLEELENQLKQAMSHSRLMTMSAREGEGVDDLMVRLSAFVRKVT